MGRNMLDESKRKVRRSFFLDRRDDEGLEALSEAIGVSKARLLRRAIREMLKRANKANH